MLITRHTGIYVFALLTDSWLIHIVMIHICSYQSWHHTPWWLSVNTGIGSFPWHEWKWEWMMAIRMTVAALFPTPSHLQTDCQQLVMRNTKVCTKGGLLISTRVNGHWWQPLCTLQVSELNTDLITVVINMCFLFNCCFYNIVLKAFSLQNDSRQVSPLFYHYIGSVN